MIRALTLIGFLILPAIAAAQDADTICNRMEREGRLGPLSFAACRCNHAVALEVLDPDLRALLFESWYTGKDNMQRAAELRPRRRVERQLEKMFVTARDRCS